MKKLKMIYGWILFSVVVQMIVLSYVNFIYLPGRGAVKATAYEDDSFAVKSRSYTLPDGAGTVTVSFDGQYAAYVNDSKLVITDLGRKKNVKELESSEGTFTYFRWLPDRDMLIYSIKEPDGKSGQVRISTYDIGPGLDRSYPNIKGLPEGSEVVDIELSPLTNIVYPMIKTSKSKARIYKFDIMDNLKSVMTTGVNSVIKETMYADRLIYQTSDGKIRLRNGKTGRTVLLPVKAADYLLAVDENDFIYTAAIDESNKLSVIYSGKEGQKASEWENVKLEQPVDAADVFVTAEGAIYTADRENKEIRALEGTGVTGYKGELLTVLDDYVVSLNGNKLLTQVLKK